MQYLRIRNWEKYQTIAGQNAPFVRLQTAILLDIEFMCLPDRERLCFLLLLAFAGVSANKIPDSANHIMHLCHMDDEPNLALLMERGLLEPWDAEKHQQMLDAHEESLRNNRERQRRFRTKQTPNAPVTRDKRVINTMSRVETETETETETKDGAAPPPTIWDAGVAQGLPRSLVGKWIKAHGEGRTAEVIAKLAVKRPADPVQFGTALLQDRPEKLFVPKLDADLVPFAQQHGLPDPGKTETYDEYRKRLWPLVKDINRRLSA